MTYELRQFIYHLSNQDDPAQLPDDWEPISVSFAFRVDMRDYFYVGARREIPAPEPDYTHIEKRAREVVTKINMQQERQNILVEHAFEQMSGKTAEEYLKDRLEQEVTGNLHRPQAKTYSWKGVFTVEIPVLEQRAWPEMKREDVVRVANILSEHGRRGDIIPGQYRVHDGLYNQAKLNVIFRDTMGWLGEEADIESPLWFHNDLSITHIKVRDFAEAIMEHYGFTDIEQLEFIQTEWNRNQDIGDLYRLPFMIA